MDTKELYGELCAIRSRHETNCINFTKRIIKENEIPDNCQYCLFRVCLFRAGLGAQFCQVLKNFVDEPQCSVYDFTKYILEHI